MNAWNVSRDQWVAWIEQGPGQVAPAAGPLDELDAQLVAKLQRNPFSTGEEETISRPEPMMAPAMSADSMTTMVRRAVDQGTELDATRVRPGSEPLEVGLKAPEDGLEVSLESSEDSPTILTQPSAAVRQAAAATDPSAAPPEPGGTVVAEAPAAPPESGGTVVAEAPPAPVVEGEGLFIPTLVQPTPEPEPVPEPEPEPEPVPEPEPIDRTVLTPAADQPPARSGETVIAPAPTAPDASASAASGSFTSVPDPEEAAQTLVRGEIPSDLGGGAKVVVGPMGNGGAMLGSIYDEEEPDEGTVEDEEPQELDADDLVEEADEAAEPVDAGPPPAPPPRPAVDAGPPPPPVSSGALDAAMANLPPAPPVDEGWQVDAFAEHYAALQPVQRPQVVTSEVEFILHCAGLGQGANVLDVGCGDGAHCVAMAARGLVVTGLDPSPAQLMRATQTAQSTGMSINLVAGDMRQPPFDTQFDAITCLGGTLGMFTEEDDRLTLRQMHDHLLPGGRLVIHALNGAYISGRLPARSWWQGQGCLVLDEAQMYSATSRLHVHRTVVFETGSQFEHNIGLRVYSLTELVHMCAGVGLRVLEFSGSRHTRGRFYGATSSEIWLVAQRPPA